MRNRLNSFAARLVGVLVVVFASGVAGAATLPDGYTQLQYIQSSRSGSTRIVTNYTPVPGTDVIEAVIAPVQVAEGVNQGLWCARGNSATANTFSFFLAGAQFRYDYGNGSSATGTPFGEPAADTVYTIVVSNNVITVNGTVGQTFAPVTYTVGGPLVLFSRYHNGTGNNKGDYADVKLYAFRVWRADDLIHNYVPCTDGSGNATLYDAGSLPSTLTREGTFTAGPAPTHDFDIAEIPNQLRFLSALYPEPVVKDPTSGTTLVKGTDYTLAYANNNAPGTGILTVTGKGAYAGKSETVYFNIYQRVKSITSTGSQYINTGIVPGPTTAVEMRFNTGTFVENSAFFGAGAYNANNSYVLYQQWFFYYFRGANTALGVLTENNIDAYLSINTNAANNAYIDVGGNRTTKTVSLAYTGSNKLELFSCNGGSGKSKFTLYAFKMWQNGVLVRDFIPVRGAHHSGLVDLVTTNFFKSATSSNFTSGPDLTDLTVAKISHQYYAGAALEPSVVVSNLAGTAVLVRGADYTVAYEDNAAVGTGKAIVTGKGAYSSVVTNTFKIYPAAPSAPAMSASAYVQHGLLNHWDGFDNAGTGTFDPAATTWKDLKGSLDFTLNGNAQWGEGFLDVDGYCGEAAAKTGQYRTIEIRHRNTLPRSGMPFASGYSVYRVAWYEAASQFWLHHSNNSYDNTLTGLTFSDTTDRDITAVYGATSSGADMPMLFYNRGIRVTSGISNQKLQSNAIDWVNPATARIGGGSATRFNYAGRLYSIRLYACPLTAQEIAYNAAVDRVRYDNVAPAEAFNASDMRWNATSGKVEVLIDLSMLHGEGALAVNGGSASAWVSVGDAVTVVYTSAAGEEALDWTGLPDDAACSADKFTVTFAAAAAVSARLQIKKPIDVTRALNADPGCEEGAGVFNDGGNKTYLPTSWQRTADRAWLGTHGTTSDTRGYHFLRPYQGNTFTQPGLALPAGTYTLTYDHAAETEHLVCAWQLVDTNNVVQTLSVVTNELRTYGTAWRTIQADFTVAADGVYKLQIVKSNNGAGGNCTVCFDNISITSDTDLHIEVEKCYPYFGGQARPPVVVRDDAGNVLTEGVDYELLYGANNTVGSGIAHDSTSYKHGNGYVAAKGLGKHYGVAGANFRLGTPIHVKPDGSASNGGTSWADAVDFTTALSLAAAQIANSEIWVAGSNVLTAAATTQSFFGNKIIRGGFKGTEATIEEREAGAYSTVDGAEAFSAIVFKNCSNVHFERMAFRGSPSRAVSKVGWTGNVYIDDCQFVTNGNAVYVQGLDKSPYAQGGVYVTDSVFRDNYSTNAADGTAALHSYRTRRVSVENSLFVSNTLATSAKVKTSAILAQYAALELQECDFIGNIGEGATYGTVRASGSDATDRIQNCLFRGNRTDGANGAAVSLEHASLAKVSEVVNCTFVANANATAGGCAGVKGVKGAVNVRNAIFTGNGVDFADHANCPFDVDFTLLADNSGSTYSFVNGASKLGTSMSYGDPLFVGAEDNHVLSEAGYFDATGGLHYAAKDVRSPAIDAGDPASEYSRESANNGGCVNLGRYGNTEQASRTPVAEPEVEGTPQVTWNDPDGYSRPTVTFTMGGRGTYSAQAVIYVSTDDGKTWTDVSGTIGGLVKGVTRTFAVPVYYVPGTTIKVKVAVSGAGYQSVSATASETVSGNLPPWYGKKGPENVIHVRAGAIGKNDGTSWTDAFVRWADALDAVSELKNEIWVAGTNEMDAAAATKSWSYAVTVRGGFRGWEQTAAERPEGLRAVLDGKDQFDIFLFSNSGALWIERVAFVRGTNRGIRKSASSGDITLTNCVFFANSQGSGVWDCQSNVNMNYKNGGGGAGLYGSGSAKAKVVDCRFEANITRGTGNCGYGGGMFIGDFGGGAEIVRCAFMTNYMRQGFTSAGGSMAALHIYNTRATVEGCSFYGHRANGSVDIRDACAGSVFRNCSFVGNYGNATAALTVKLANASDSAMVENCTFAYNFSTPALNCAQGAVTVRNCIFYGNLAGVSATAAADLRVASTATADVDYCLFAQRETEDSKICVSETTAGTLTLGSHCVYGDPLFVTPATNVLTQASATAGAMLPRVLPAKWDESKVPSYAKRAAYNVHLRSRVGYCDEQTGLPVRFRGENSPAIDAGDPASPYANEAERTFVGCNGRRVNLGCYGNTPYATMTPIRGAFLRVR